MKIVLNLLINRTVDEVFTFLTDPRNFMHWQKGVVESTIDSDNIQVGTSGKFVRRVWGRTVEAHWEVLDFNPPHKSVDRVHIGPLTLIETVTLKPQVEKTWLRFEGDIQLPVHVLPIQPLFSLLARQMLRRDFNNFKLFLEQN